MSALDMPGTGQTARQPALLTVEPVCWRAQFTLEHYHDEGFTGGIFTAVLPSGRAGDVLTMDYTPELVLDVARRFAAWVDRWREPVAVVVLKGREEVYRWRWADVTG